MTLSGRGVDGAATSELRLRVVSSIVLGFAAIGATWWGGWPFAVLWLAAGIAVAHEWLTVTGVRRASAITAVIGTGLVGFVIARRLGLPTPGPALILAAAALLAPLVASGARDRGWAELGFSYSVPVALVPIALRDEPGWGLAAILWMFAVVWATDIAAYFTGRALGGPKLWPAVSPKKTWSGFTGGLAAGTGAGLLVALGCARAGAQLPVGWAALAVGSAMASVVSQIGDLGESALKRRFDVKDSGRLIPGHGGVMDRLDGFAAVAMLVGLALLGARFAGQPSAS